MNMFSKMILSTTANSSSSSLILLVAMFGIFYYFIIRPQKKREKEIKEMRASLKKGDDIVSIGGIYGKILKIDDEKITLELQPSKQKLIMAKWSVQKIVSETQEDTEEEQ